jgi:hypothetical protein
MGHFPPRNPDVLCASVHSDGKRDTGHALPEFDLAQVCATLAESGNALCLALDLAQIGAASAKYHGVNARRAERPGVSAAALT